MISKANNSTLPFTLRRQLSKRFKKSMADPLERDIENELQDAFPIDDYPNYNYDANYRVKSLLNGEISLCD